MTEVSIDSDGSIRDSDGTRIGKIHSSKNTIKKIEIYPFYQNEGYGTAAVKEFASACYEEGAEEMYVACITNEYLTRILDDFEGEEINSHQLPISPHPMLEPEKKDYVVSLPIE